MPGSVRGVVVVSNFPLLQLGRPQPQYVTQETDLSVSARGCGQQDWHQSSAALLLICWVKFAPLNLAVKS